METIKVNMSPNPLDVQTIHASQNDGEARQWGFELHNNGELIDTSDVKEQLFFKAYKGGTEQILPENTSTPTTSPFKGDIKYPQGLLSDQEFLYRESPTESDGLAKITSIKGNTLGWNQLIDVTQTGATEGWGSTITRDGTALTVTNTRDFNTLGFAVINKANLFIKGHKYLVIFDLKSSSFTPTRVMVNITTNWTVIGSTSVPYNGNTRYGIIVDVTDNGVSGQPQRINLRFDGTVVTDDSVVVSNIQLFDLTQMDLDITDPSEFTSLFPLPYYDYNQGTLIPFSGNGIKTVGFNQWDEEWEAGILNSDGSTSSSSDRIITSYVPVLPNITYSMTIPYNGKGRGAFYDENKHLIEYFYDFPVSGRNDVFPRDGLISYDGNNYYFSFIPPAGTAFVRYNTISAYGATYENNICINISDSSKNGTYEPYTSSTLSLPISTYFPTGMKSAETVYDELTNEKATKRLTTITFDGTENWALHGSIASWFYVDDLMSDAKFVNDQMPLKNINNEGYESASYVSAGRLLNMQFTFNPTSGATGGSRTIFKNTSCTTVDQWKAYLQSHPLTICYEIATPTETSFTTASLVTENAEIPLSNNDGTLIGKCTEELSAEPGFHDAKIKLADADGTCYSNKLQLHIERSPQ